VVDVANVMGARPDGWWRDRAGAARRLYAQVSELAVGGISVGQLPGELLSVSGQWLDLAASPGEPPATRMFRPRWVLVVEGKARPAPGQIETASTETGEVLVVSAPGEGDDEIVSQAAAWSATAPCLVVTADRELRRRCAAVGAKLAGPGWLLSLL
jgi:hypothetical protein